MTDKERLLKLRIDLHQHNVNYYINDQPTVSDITFDELLKELEGLELKYPEWSDINSPTVRVGGGITKSFPTVKHRYPMLSLSNSYSLEEIQEWILRVQKLEPEASFTQTLPTIVSIIVYFKILFLNPLILFCKLINTS